MKPITILIFALVLLVVALASLCLGKYPLPLLEVARFLVYEVSGRGTIAADRLPLLQNVIVEVRLPRIMTASLIGAALSVSGATYQAMFLNPLVSPGLLGVLAGASFGSALGMVFLKGWFAVQLATFLGGCAAVAISLFIARMHEVNGTIMMVLGGIISGALFSSLLSVVKYLADPYNQLPAIVYWLMGNMAMADRGVALKAGVPMCLGICSLALLSRQLNALAMGDEEATALGVNVKAVRLTAIVCATLISTLTVMLGGVIGWVGLIIPHLARMMVGPDNGTLLPVAALLGASYLLVSDNISRLLFSCEIPIGIVTSLLGIPFFRLVLANSRKGWR